jgi:predicted Zn-dependent protease
LAGNLISNNYTRPLELEADRHAVELLERAGYSKRTMISTLDWLMRRNGDGGGMLSTHPATSDNFRTHSSTALAPLISARSDLRRRQAGNFFRKHRHFYSVETIVFG